MYEAGLSPRLKLTVFPSEETAIHRYDKDAPRHRKGVSRCSPTSQIVFGGNWCAHQTLRSALLSNRPIISLTGRPKEAKDVQDKLGDLIPWLTKLKDIVMTASADGSPEEAERREELTRFVPYPYCRDLDSCQPSPVHWKI